MFTDRFSRHLLLSLFAHFSFYFIFLFERWFCEIHFCFYSFVGNCTQSQIQVIVPPHLKKLNFTLFSATGSTSIRCCHAAVAGRRSTSGRWTSLPVRRHRWRTSTRPACSCYSLLASSTWFLAGNATAHSVSSPVFRSAQASTKLSSRNDASKSTCRRCGFRAASTWWAGSTSSRPGLRGRLRTIQLPLSRRTFSPTRVRCGASTASSANSVWARPWSFFISLDLRSTSPSTTLTCAVWN